MYKYQYWLAPQTDSTSGGYQLPVGTVVRSTGYKRRLKTVDVPLRDGGVVVGDGKMPVASVQVRMRLYENTNVDFFQAVSVYWGLLKALEGAYLFEWGVDLPSTTERAGAYWLYDNVEGYDIQWDSDNRHRSGWVTFTLLQTTAPYVSVMKGTA